MRFGSRFKDGLNVNVSIKEHNLNFGSGATIITVRTVTNPFSFFLRDVSKEYPIFIPDYGVIATDADDTRSYEQVGETIRNYGLKTKLKQIQSEDEESYKEAAANTRKLRCPTWLGVSRDIRIFEVDFRGGRLDWIQPRFHGPLVSLPESNNNPVCYQFFIGRGIGCVENVSRSLKDGVLPILCGSIIDEDINYNITAFVTLERNELTSKNLRGTHFLVADGNAFGHTFTDGQEKEFQKLQPEEMNRDEETVLFYRIKAKNMSSVLRYAWFKSIASKLLKSCEYIIRCRQRNKDEGLRGKGYGMIEGQVADPHDPYHQFMLNGYAYLGLSRVAEMFSKLDPIQSRRIKQEAEELKSDIREAFFEAIARSPVVPLGDGTWCPTAPPWAEARGLLSLYAEKGNWFSHLTFFCRDSLLGPFHLIFQEIIDPKEKAADQLVNCCTELMHERNVALSQPYYSQHPWVHLKRGEIKAFLKAYYNSLASLSDQETYTFWEHYPGVGSPHKTHEEGWFLMQTRWMLWTEQGQTLKLLSGIPRDWMENGKRIELNKVASYFGHMSLKVESKLKQGWIVAKIECPSKQQPRILELRLPHPDGVKATKVKGGTYDAQTETVKIEPFKDSAEVILEF